MKTFPFFITGLVPEDQFDVELIIQCIRSSESPQTHNQALLLLATAAKLFPVSKPFVSNCYNMLEYDYLKGFVNFLKLLQYVVLNYSYFYY